MSGAGERPVYDVIMTCNYSPWSAYSGGGQKSVHMLATAMSRQGMKVGRVPAEFEADLKRMGEKFSREWVQSVGTEANLIFVPYFFQR